MRYMKFLFYTKKHRVLVSIIVFLIMITVSFAVKIRSSKAILGFGGRITEVTFCTCTQGSWAYTVVGDPSGVFVYTPLAVPYKWYNFLPKGVYTYPVLIPFTSPWILGSYVPTPVVSSCWMYAAEACYPLPSLGEITSFGTSKY